MKVFFIPKDVDGSGCYRAIFPALALQQKGHTTSLPAFKLLDENGQPIQMGGTGLGSLPQGNLNVGFLQESVPSDWDVYVFQTGTSRFMYEWATILKEQYGRTILLDLDDDLHRVPKYNPGQLSPGQNPDVNRKWAQRMCELADGISCATPALADFYRRWNPNIRVIPNLLHWPMWENLPEAKWNKFRVGYMGSTDFHRADLEVLGKKVGKWIEHHPDTEFVAAGDPRIHDILCIPRAQRVSTSATAFRCLDLPTITACMDVGLVPLARNVFNEGKSCLKGMEYAACGIPCLASPTAEYRRWVHDGTNGYLCQHPDDFVARLDQLYANRELAKGLGDNARLMVQDWTFQQKAHLWEDWLGSNRDHTDDPRPLTAVG